MPIETINIGSSSHLGRINSTSNARYDVGTYDMDRYDIIQVLDSLTIVTRTDLWKPSIIGAEQKETDDGKPIIKSASRGL